MAHCLVCNDLDVYNLNLEFENLREGVQNGCSACSMLFQGISHFVSPDDVSKFRIFVDYALYVEIIRREKGEPIFVEFSTRQGLPSIWPRIGPGRDISLNSSSDNCLQLAKSWLNKCLTSHKQCRSLSEEPLLPTRVLDVGTSSADIHLYLTKGDKGKYATLSHCWGSRSIHSSTTTRDTIEDRIRLIEFDVPSKTFSQAAEVIRSLGIRYLWIDSLCIVQDSEEDWSRESEKMGEIYHNATVNLSAASALNASQGLFPDSAERNMLHAVFELSCPGPNGAISLIRVRSRHDDPSNLRKLSHSSTPSVKSKLSTRGWVLQESTLSPRTLYFAKEEMYWICSTLSRCECKIRPGQAPSSLFRRKLQGLTEEPDAKFFRDLYMEWPLLVMDFTRRDLTRDSDRLPALSGLAGWMQRQTGDLYLCGLWAANLRFELLWYSKSSTHDTHCRLQDPYAPSWSWASITGSVTYYGPYVTQFGQRYAGYQAYEVDVSGGPTSRDETPIKIVDVAVHPFSSNKYGPGKASIELYGHILPVKYNRAQELWESPIITMEYFDPKSLQFKYDVYLEIPGVLAAASTTENFVFLFMGILISPWAGYIVGTQVICLLLQRVEESAPIFKRRGVVTKAGDDKTWKAVVPKSNILLV